MSQTGATELGRRKLGKRYPSGKLRPQPRERDGPTPENEAKRFALVCGGDPTLSTTPLDVLLARKLISVRQHAAGATYAYLYRRVIGGGPIGGVGIEIIRVPGHADDYRDDAKNQRRFRAAESALRLESRSVKDAVENLVVWHRWPRQWNGLERLYRGLDALAKNL